MKLQLCFACVVVVLAGCGAPVATFVAIGYRYPYRTIDTAAVVVYMKPNNPARPYRVVGSIVVAPPSNDCLQPTSPLLHGGMPDYITALKAKAAAVGVDGVTNVEAAPRTITSASGGCIYGMPYYSENSSTVYDVRGDAFVWAESAATPDTARLNVAWLDSMGRVCEHQPPAPDTGRHSKAENYLRWGCMSGLAVSLVAIIVMTFFVH